MKVLVVGAGIIGSIYGWALSGAGHQVVHLVRAGRTGSTATRITVDMLDGRRGHKNSLSFYDRTLTEHVDADDAFDVVIVPTKPYQLLDTLSELARSLPASRFLLLTQNWDGTQDIDELLPRSRYVFGDAHAGGVFNGDRLVATLFADIVLGHVEGGRHPVLDECAELFSSADLTITTPGNILHYIWVQYAINAGLWTGLVRSGGLEELLRDSSTGKASLRAVNECLDVVRALGVDLRDYSDAHIYMRARSQAGMVIAGLLVRAMFTFNAKVRRASAHGLGDPTEIAAAFHALLSSGEAAGLRMETMRSFIRDIDEFAEAAR